MLIDKIFYVNDKGYDESQIDAIVEKTILNWLWKKGLFVIKLCGFKVLIRYMPWAHIGHMYNNILDSMWFL